MNDFGQRLRRAGEAGPGTTPALGRDLVARGRARRRQRGLALGAAGLVLLAAVGVGVSTLGDASEVAPVITNPSEALPRPAATTSADPGSASSATGPKDESQGPGRPAAPASGSTPTPDPTQAPTALPTDPTAEPTPTTEPRPGAVPGVTADEIVVRTVVRRGVVSSFTAVNAPAVEAYVAYANSELPPIHGRRLRLEVVNLDAVTDPAEVYGPACDEVFALVGNLGDEDATRTTEACGLPDVRAVAHHSRQHHSPVTAAVRTVLPSDASLDAWRQWADREPFAVERAGWIRVLDTDVPAADQARRALDVQDATAELGYQWVVDFEAPMTGSGWYDDAARALRDAEVEFVHVDAWSVDAVVRLRDALRRVGHAPLLVTAAGRLQDQFLPGEGEGLDGVELAVDRIPVEEVGVSDASQRLATWLDHVAPGQQPTADDILAWSATELLVEQLRALGPDPTRQGLVGALARVRAFDAGGMLGARAVVGGHEPTCHALLRHDGARLRRVDARGFGYVDC